jgi:LysM repeat protein
MIKNISRLALLVCCAAFMPRFSLPLSVSTFAKTFLKAPDKNIAGIGGGVFPEGTEQTVITRNVAFSLENPEGQLVEGVSEPVEFSLPGPLLYASYLIKPGDMIGFLSTDFGLNQDTLISFNGINNTRGIQAGKPLLIPNQDGIMHKAAAGDTVKSIAAKYEVGVDAIVTVNELFGEKLTPGKAVFVPGARLSETMLQEINGDLFIWPVRGRISSRYGYRISPISGTRMFHTGLDIAASYGTPIRAGMPGRVITAGWSDVFGYYVVIAHHSNYRTLYGHMSKIRTKSGAYVRTGETIGNVGSTGQSTGAHLHFQVYKNGITVNPLLLMN